jgi:hypothetical protein
MRRNVALLVLIAALVAAVALLRPRPIVLIEREAPVAAGIVAPRPEPMSEEGEFEEAAPPPPALPPVAEKKVVPARPDPLVVTPAEPNWLTVVDPDGAPIKEAVVFWITHSYANPSSNSRVREWRTDEEGRLKITLGQHDTAHFVSYKVGLGSGIVGPVRTGVDVTLKYEKDLAVAFKCVAPHGVALEGAEVVLTTELLLGRRQGEAGQYQPIVISLPPRKLLTDREGACSFGSVFPPRPAKAGWPPVPGFRHRVKATWHTMGAEEAIEKMPEGPLTLVLDQ